MVTTTDKRHSNLPLISIIIPCFNAGKFLREALDSALDQDVPVEIIVQDGGSTDRTIELLQSYGNRITFESAPDSGQSQALNRALSRATGDFIGWLNADDLYAPEAIATVCRVVSEQSAIDLVYGDYALVREDGQQLRRYYVQPLSHSRVFDKGCYVWSGATFIRRRVLESVGGFDETLHYCMDFDMLLRVSPVVQSLHVPKVLGAFRIHSNSKSGGLPWKFVTEAHKVRRKHSNGTLRSTLITLKVDFTTTLYLATRRLWMSDMWASVRRSKRR